MSRRQLAFAGLAAIGVVVLTPRDMLPNVFQTPATKSIGDRWAAVGGTDTHTPGVATRRGTEDDVQPKQSTPSGPKSDDFQENQAAQRPGKPGPFDKAWNQSHYGVDKAK